jgi:hypothetical protein
MIRITTLILAAALSQIMGVLSLEAAPPTRITAPKIITVPGSYVLANDITGTTTGNVIAIRASEVTLSLNKHTITANQGTGIYINDTDINNVPLVNAHVSDGQIVAGNLGVGILGSSCLINGLSITVSQSGTPIQIERPGNFNRVHSCVLSAATGQTGRAAFSLFLTSHNTIPNNTLTGIYSDTIEEDDQAGTSATVVGDNTFSENEFANPSQ